jgi:hypothetical protein
MDKIAKIMTTKEVILDVIHQPFICCSGKTGYRHSRLVPITGSMSTHWTFGRGNKPAPPRYPEPQINPPKTRAL